MLRVVGIADSRYTVSFAKSKVTRRYSSLLVCHGVELRLFAIAGCLDMAMPSLWRWQVGQPERNPAAAALA